MNFQIGEIRELGIPSVIALTDDVLQTVCDGKYTLVFGAAEDFLKAQFKNILKDEDAALHKCVSLIVVDKCHAVLWIWPLYCQNIPACSHFALALFAFLH